MKLQHFLVPLEILFLLVTSNALGQNPAPSPRPMQELRLTRIESITDSLSSNHYFYLKEEGFRIQLPGSFTRYVASNPASAKTPATDGQIDWNLPEAEVTIMFSDMDAKTIAAFTMEQKRRVLTSSLDAMTYKDGVAKVSERDLSVNGVPAREAKFKIGAKEYLARSLFLGSRFFVFVVYLHPVENAEAIVKKALDTFEAVSN